MNNLDTLIKYYGEFEIKVQDLINELFGSFCVACHDPCCRLDICEEAKDSLFLQRIRAAHNQEEHMSDNYGWLEPTGCCLHTGRPPVCSEYLCDELLNNLPTPFERYIAIVLSALMTYVGEHAVGELHLCEILHESDLEKVNEKVVLKRLEAADKTFNAIRYFCEHGKVNAQMRDALSLILPIPEDAAAFCI
jgi:hypothetical protein